MTLPGNRIIADSIGYDEVMVEWSGSSVPWDWYPHRRAETQRGECLCGHTGRERPLGGDRGRDSRGFPSPGTLGPPEARRRHRGPLPPGLSGAGPVHLDVGSWPQIWEMTTSVLSRSICGALLRQPQGKNASGTAKNSSPFLSTEASREDIGQIQWEGRG